jgi:protein TonB
MALYHSFDLPWTYIREESERLKRFLVIALVIAVILGIAMPFMPLKKLDRQKAEELPPRLAQLVLEKKKPKPPPPKKVEKKKEKKKVEKKKKKEKPKKKEVKKKPKKPKKTEAQRVAEARKKAASSGLLQFADELADLREAAVDKALKKTAKLSKGQAKSSDFKRNVLTSGVTSGSGGIDTSRLSSGVGRSNLAGRKTTKVEDEMEKLAMAKRVEQEKRTNRKPARTYEEVSLVFDKNKGAIYALYNRALRRDPTLEGKVVLELTIAPSGRVTHIRIVSSELKNPVLEEKLMTRIKLFNFGVKKVEELIVTYPIDFLPP